MMTQLSLLPITLKNSYQNNRRSLLFDYNTCYIYTIINNKEALGEILELIEQPHQLLCRLEIKGKEVLIPLHEETLQKVNHQKKEVLVVLPEGLLEIYLQ